MGLREARGITTKECHTCEFCGCERTEVKQDYGCRGPRRIKTQRFTEGDHLRVAIPSETDPDYGQYDGVHRLVVSGR